MADRMEELSIPGSGLKVAHDNQRKDREAKRAKIKAAHDKEEQDYQALISKLDERENALQVRLAELNKAKCDPSRANLDASCDDLVEINAGGKVVAAKRSNLTRLAGTRFEALFGGRWERKLQRDSSGRIFLDVEPVCFQAIVDYLNELAISSEDSPPAPRTWSEDRQQGHHG